MGIYSVLPAPITSETNMKPEYIKGYMTLEDISKDFRMDLNEIYKKLDLPISIPKLKDIQNIIPDFETEGTREKLK